MDKNLTDDMRDVYLGDSYKSHFNLFK